VRELRFAVERAGLLADGEAIDLHDLPPEIRSARGEHAGPEGPVPAVPPASPGPRGRGPDAARIRQALEQTRWNRQRAAEVLGVSPRTLFRWMQRLGL
jgi:transcriptional regulator of acetoin/glycerol metabolism